MAEAAEVACVDTPTLVDEGLGPILGGGVVLWLEEVESMTAMAGGGGRPGVDFIGGGRTGSGFVFEGRGGRGGSLLVFSGWGCMTGPFLWAGTGATCFKLGPAPGGLASGVRSADGDEAPGCLVARVGALALRGELRAAGLAGRPGRTLPLTFVFTAFCVPSLPLSAWVRLLGLGGSVGMAFTGGASFSWLAGLLLALGATAGLGGSLG